MVDATFYCQSSKEMTALEDDSIALTVTSPPYWNAIDEHWIPAFAGMTIRDCRQGFRNFRDL